MTLAAKLLIGAIIGACLALLVSSEVRAHWFAGWLISRNPVAEIAPTQLSKPDSMAESGQWVILAAERLQRKLPISKADWNKLDTVLARAVAVDRGNAFWLQMTAAFQHSRSRSAEALVTWKQAARGSRWNDYQTGKMLELRRRMDSHGSTWSAAVAYGRTSDAPTQLIEQYARYLIRQSSLDTENGLDRRYRTLQNGDLIRKFARSVQTGEAGAGIVEIAAYPSDLSPILGPHKLLLTRLEFQNKLRAYGMGIQAEVADRAFRNSDGWAAYANSSRSNGRVNQIRWQALFTDCGPGALLWVAIVGLGLWALGWNSERSPRFARLWEWPFCVMIGSFLGIMVILTTQFELAGLALAAAFCFLGWRPHLTRDPADLPFGPLYRFSLLVLGVMIGVCVLGYAIGLSRVGWLLCDSLEVPLEYYGASPIFAGVAALTFGLLVGIAPAFGWAYRIDPTRIAAATFHAVGRALAISGIVGSIILTPLSMYISGQTSTDLTKILENEPLFYLSD